MRESIIGGTLPATSYSYDATGNITGKTIGSLFSTYDYGSGGTPHAVKSITFGSTDYGFVYDANGNMTDGYDFTDPAQPVGREIDYNADNMPVEVRHDTHGTTHLCLRRLRHAGEENQ